MRVPKYRRHSLGKAFVEVGGKRTYLPGMHGSEESRLAYIDFVAKYKASVRAKAEEVADEVLIRPDKKNVTIADVVAAFLVHAKSHYAESRSGTSEFECCRNTGERLIRFAGRSLAERFGPLRLKAFRQSLVDERVTRKRKSKDGETQTTEIALSRRYINMHMNRVRRMFRWAASEELISEHVWSGLRSVDGLRAGRTKAPELPARQPIAWSQVEPVLTELSPALARMVELQWLTGVRPQSVILATAEQFDLEKKVWMPAHKNEWRGQHLVIPLGPRAAELAREQIAESGDMTFLFCPLRIGGRANPLYGLRYTVSSYRQALQRAQDRAKISPRWTPHQIRHGRATEVRNKYGLEAAQAVLGHASIDASQIYASRLFELARRVSDETG